MKEKIISFIYHQLDYLPENLSMKIKVMCNVLVHNWTFETPSLFDINQAMPEDKARQLFPEADQETLHALHLHYVLGPFCHQDIARCVFLNKDTLLQGNPISDSEKKAIHQSLKHFSRTYGISNPNTETAYYKHGSTLFTPNQRDYVRNKAIIDAGAYIGDSVLALQDLAPARIFAFEPSHINMQTMVNTLSQNNISTASYELIEAGLDNSDHDIILQDTGSARFTTLQQATSGNTLTCHLISLDSFMQAHPHEHVGFIKADIEGAALRMIQGAEQTIKRDKPILSIAVYHSAEELLGIPQLLASWQLGYSLQLRRLQPFSLIGETTIIAIPNIAQ